MDQKDQDNAKKVGRMTWLFTTTAQQYLIVSVRAVTVIPPFPWFHQLTQVA